MSSDEKCERCGYKPLGDVSDWLLIVLVKQPDGTTKSEIICGECYLRDRLGRTK